jgi:cob(I)alamin adenosyltransferase
MATRCAGMFYTGSAAMPGDDRFEAAYYPAYCAAARSTTGEGRMKTEGITPEEINARHAEKMAKRKAARDKILATKTKEKGLLIVHTGKGKGKTTAAMGLAVRAVGNGMKVGIVQFVKGVWNTGERKVLEHFPELCVMKAMGEGFTWDTQDRERDIAAARKAWATAKEMMADEGYQMVILDELNIVLRYDYIDLDEVVACLRDKRRDLHVVVTGRNAKESLLEIADLVTEMAEIRHHFRDGVKAQLGIEF